MPGNKSIDCVLFDLDGTLVDTAPDLIACLNRSLQQHGYNTVPHNQIRPYISYGAEVMIQQSVEGLEKITHDSIHEQMLDFYETNIAEYSCFFKGIEEALATIKQLGLKWGIVTNKVERFALPLAKALEIEQQAACIICGDTTANAKPHPEPMFKACELAGVQSENCIYIGDARHDIEAGRGAGMLTMAATYGYLKKDDEPEKWAADVLLDTAEQLSPWLKSQCL